MANRTTELLQAAITAGLRKGRRSTTLEAVVQESRAKGMSWEHTASEVYARSGVMVSRQTLINWFPEYNKPADELVPGAAK